MKNLKITYILFASLMVFSCSDTFVEVESLDALRLLLLLSELALEELVEVVVFSLSLPVDELLEEEEEERDREDSVSTVALHRGPRPKIAWT